MLATTTKHLKTFGRERRGISNVIVVMLSLILIVVIVSNVVLWSYQMNQLDWERMQESVAITNAESTAGFWSYNPSEYILGGTTSRISGQISDLISNNDVYMTYRSYYSTDTSHFVDNNSSDADSSGTKGSHSDFQAQKAGPDNTFDVVTEQDTSKIVFRQVTVTSDQFTTNTAWTDVSGASLSFKPNSLTEEWLILISADIRCSSAIEDQARFRYYVGNMSFGETGIQQGTINTAPIDPYDVYFHFTRITGTTLQQTVKFQFQASPGVTAYARNVHILCIRLDEAELEYSEVNGNTAITGLQTLVTLQFTPPSPGDYIVAYCGLVSELPIGGGAETWLDYDFGSSLYPPAWSTPNTRRIHTDRDQYEPHGLFTRINLNAVQHTLRVQTQLQLAGETSTARDVRIVAFRVDAFDLFEFDEDTGVTSTTGANTVKSVVNTANPGEQRDYLVLAGIHTISSGTGSREAGGVEIDDVFVQRKGDQRLSLSDIARIASHFALVKTTSTSFKVETTYGRGGVGSDTIYSKQSVIYVLKIPRNYELDSEAQWTNATHNLPNEELCIYGGTMGSESIQVDVWNGSAWINVFADLNNGWNNVSISAYLNSSTFTIRFKGTNETNDTAQDSWNIDAALVHVWSNECISEVEFTGSSSTDAWSQLNWTVDSAWTIDSVNVTLQLYNYTLNGYPTNGNGYMAYTSTSTPNIDENRTQTINVNPAQFRNITGHWKIKITGTKTTTQFDLKVDWIEFKVAKNVGTLFTFKNKGSVTSHLVSLWIINLTTHQRYNINVFLNSGETCSLLTNIVLPTDEYMVKTVTKRGNVVVYNNS